MRAPRAGIMHPKLVLTLQGVRNTCVDDEKVYSVHDYVVQWRALRGITCQRRDAPRKKVFTPKAYAHTWVHRIKRRLGVDVKTVLMGGVPTPCVSMQGLYTLRELLRSIKKQDKRGTCPHGKKSTYYCKRCAGNGICEHMCRREVCAKCNPTGYATNRIRHAIYMGIRKGKRRKDKRTLCYLGVRDFDDVVLHLQRKMDAYNATDPPTRMTFANTHIDHVKPLRQFIVESEATGELDSRMHHYTNLQPLLIEDNLHKSNQWNDRCEQVWRENIIENPEFLDIFNPFQKIKKTR